MCSGRTYPKLSEGKSSTPHEERIPAFTPGECQSILKPFQRFGVHLGLDSAVVGKPRQSTPSSTCHSCSGTNGKGSVCAYLSSVLTQGLSGRTLYLTPFSRLTERICSTNNRFQACAATSASASPDGLPRRRVTYPV